MVWGQLLGGTALEGPTGPVTGPAAQRHRLALLAVLAVARTEWTSRDKLVACLWPERDAEHARNLLSQAVHALRRALGEEAIRSQGDTIRLDPTLVPTDLEAFEKAVARRDWVEAVEQYRGPFLDGFFLPDAPEFEQWVDGERARLGGMFQAALEALAQEAAATGDAPTAVRWWLRLAAEDRLSGRIALGLMRALAASGDRAAAIQHARIHADLLREELGADPDPEVEALAGRLRSPVPADPEPAPAAPPRRAADVESPVPAADSPSWRHPDLPGPTWPPRFRRPHMVAASFAAIAIMVAALAGKGDMAPSLPEPAAIQRIAVLPPDERGTSDADDHFTAAMHDALISELGRVAGLAVTSRQSVLRFLGSREPIPAIAAQLGVDAIVEASTYRVGDSVRVTTRIIRADPEQAIWSGEFQGILGGALGLQREAATAIAQALQAHRGSGPSPPVQSHLTVPAQAQDAYFRGLYELDRQANIGPLPPEARDSALRLAVGHLQHALNIEPEWAEAHARLATTYHWLGSGFPARATSDSFLALSEVSAQRALTLDPDNPAALAALGFVRFYGQLDFEEGESRLRRAVALEPSALHHEMLALLLQSGGRAVEALPHYDFAVAMNPLSERLHWARVSTYACAGRDEDALRLAREHVQRFGEIVAPAMPGVHAFQAHAYSWLGLHEQAVRQQEIAVALSGGLRGQLGNLAFILARAGRQVEARRILADLEQGGGPLPFPQLFAALGDTARALSHLEEWASTAPRAFVLRLPCTEGYRMLESHPRLQQLLNQARATRRVSR